MRQRLNSCPAAEKRNKVKVLLWGGMRARPSYPGQSYDIDEAILFFEEGGARCTREELLPLLDRYLAASPRLECISVTGQARSLAKHPVSASMAEIARALAYVVTPLGRWVRSPRGCQ